VRVAIVKLSSLGDVVHALPVASALRRHFADLHLTWIVEAREAALLAGHPDVDALVVVDTRRWRRLIGRPTGAAEVAGRLIELRHGLRARRFGVALDLQGLVKSGILTAFTGAPLRVGFGVRHLREPLNALFTNRRVTPPPAAAHVVEQNLALLEPLGIGDREVVFKLETSPTADGRIDAFLTEGGVKPGDRLVALNPGAGRPEKRWPVAHWRRLAERLAVDGGLRVIVSWGPGEEPLAQAVTEGLPGHPLVTPPTTLGELAALLRRVALVVSADSGPLHLAAALGTPCVGLYGPTRAARNGPYAERSRALQSPDGRMASVLPDAVLGATTELLDGSLSAAAAAGRTE
jgi:lipopolysaccharide heptosyltransferase I